MRFRTRSPRRGQAGVLGLLTLHLLLALLWAALWGPSAGQLAVGFVVGLLAIAMSGRVIRSAAYLRSLGAAAALAGLFAISLVRASLQLARDLLRRQPPFAPAILALDIRGLGPAQTALLVSLVSLTPGTVTLDLSPGEDTLFFHTLYAHGMARMRQEVERYVRLLRRMAGAGPDVQPEAR